MTVARNKGANAEHIIYKTVELAMAHLPEDVKLSDKAVKDIQKNIANLKRQFPNEPRIYIVEGDLNRRCGQFNAAIEDYHSALILDPTRLHAYLHCAQVLNAVGRYTKSQTMLQDMLKIAADENVVTTPHIAKYKNCVVDAAEKLLVEVQHNIQVLANIDRIQAKAKMKQEAKPDLFEPKPVAKRKSIVRFFDTANIVPPAATPTYDAANDATHDAKRVRRAGRSGT